MRMDPSVFTTGTIEAAQSEKSRGSIIPLLARGQSRHLIVFLGPHRVQFSVYKIEVELFHLHKSWRLYS